MPSTVASNAPDDLRRANDEHRHWVPLLVLIFLALVAYLWTDWAADYPVPGVSALEDSSVLSEAFDKGHLVNRVWIHHSRNEHFDRIFGRGRQHEVRTLLFLAGLGFLLAYYLPVRLKRGAVALVTLGGIGLVMGPSILSLLLAAHLICYGTFHVQAPGTRRTTRWFVLLALCLPFSFRGEGWPGLVGSLVISAMLIPLLYLFYTHFFAPALCGSAGRWLRPIVTQSSLIAVGALTITNWGAGMELALPMGLVLFFFQWERIFMYQIDLKDGKVPADLSLQAYLATFFSPGALANFPWLSRIPMGYAYLDNSFLARDKNRIVLSGIKLIALSVGFFALGPVVIDLLFGGDRITSYWGLLSADTLGLSPGPWLVWKVLLQEFLWFYSVWSGVAHLKVGLWRLFGYDIEPYYQMPFLSTNLVDFWRRYSYYYRAFLVQAFYYPVFLRWFKRRPMLRIFTATFAAACLGNFVYHLLFQLMTDGASSDVLLSQLRTMPYYVVLGGAISLTQVWLMKRGRRARRPWTLDRRLGLDVLAVCGTIGFFILIRPLHHVPAKGSIADGVRICLAALGVPL
jgi:hypothetical protein